MGFDTSFVPNSTVPLNPYSQDSNRELWFRVRGFVVSILSSQPLHSKELVIWFSVQGSDSGC